MIEAAIKRFVANNLVVKTTTDPMKIRTVTRPITAKTPYHAVQYKDYTKSEIDDMMHEFANDDVVIPQLTDEDLVFKFSHIM